MIAADLLNGAPPPQGVEWHRRVIRWWPRGAGARRTASYRCQGEARLIAICPYIRRAHPLSDSHDSDIIDVGGLLLDVGPVVAWPGLTMTRS